MNETHVAVGPNDASRQAKLRLSIAPTYDSRETGEEPASPLVSGEPLGKEWITTANEDNDCAIYEAASLKLIGVGATTAQTINIVREHNASLTPSPTDADTQVEEKI